VRRCGGMKGTEAGGAEAPRGEGSLERGGQRPDVGLMDSCEVDGGGGALEPLKWVPCVGLVTGGEIGEGSGGGIKPAGRAVGLGMVYGFRVVETQTCGAKKDTLCFEILIFEVLKIKIKR